MKYVEFCKLSLSRPGKLKTKFDLNVLCIFSYVAFFILVPISTDTLYVKVFCNDWILREYREFFTKNNITYQINHLNSFSGFPIKDINTGNSTGFTFMQVPGTMQLSTMYILKYRGHTDIVLSKLINIVQVYIFIPCHPQPELRRKRGKYREVCLLI